MQPGAHRRGARSCAAAPLGCRRPCPPAWPAHAAAVRPPGKACLGGHQGQGIHQPNQTIPVVSTFLPSADTFRSKRFPGSSKSKTQPFPKQALQLHNTLPRHAESLGMPGCAAAEAFHPPREVVRLAVHAPPVACAARHPHVSTARTGHHMHCPAPAPLLPPWPSTCSCTGSE